MITCLLQVIDFHVLRLKRIEQRFKVLLFPVCLFHDLREAYLSHEYLCWGDAFLFKVFSTAVVMALASTS